MDAESRRQRKAVALQKMAAAPNSMPLLDNQPQKAAEETLLPMRDQPSHSLLPNIHYIPKDARNAVKKELLSKKSSDIAVITAKSEATELSREEVFQSLLLQSFDTMQSNGRSMEANDVDDTDRPEEATQDYEAWTLRELGRMRRALEQQKAALDAREALAQIRALQGDALTAYLKEKEVAVEEARQVKEETASQFTFLQKYYHGGAFFTDDVQASAPDLFHKRHASAMPTQAEAEVDKSILPSVLQVKNFGKSSRSKWTHLSNEDTTGYDGPWYVSKKRLLEMKKGPSQAREQ